MATMREIAQHAGVSLKTVSRVFNDDPHVSPQLRERVQQALAEHDYVPNELAQTFRSGRSNIVGVVVPSLIDPFFAAIVDAIGSEARRRGFGTLVTATGFDSAEEKRAVASLRERRLAGMVIAPVSSDQAHLSSAVPTVLVDQPSSDAALDSFVHDDHVGGMLATRHLLSHGARRIGFLGREPGLATSRDRLLGYQDALTQAGEPIDARLVVADIESPDDGLEAYRRLRAHGIDALFAADPRSTISCLPALRLDPVPLVGFGDFPLADLLSPSVTVVDQNPQAMGRQACLRLFALIEAGPASSRATRSPTRLPVSLVERESCVPLASR